MNNIGDWVYFVDLDKIVYDKIHRTWMYRKSWCYRRRNSFTVYYQVFQNINEAKEEFRKVLKLQQKALEQDLEKLQQKILELKVKQDLIEEDNVEELKRY